MTGAGASSAVHRVLAGGAILGGASAWFHPAAGAPDLWWHLAAGRDIWRRGALPDGDPFSFTFAGREWINHEWLWDVGAWWLYGIDEQAVAWATLLLLLGIFGILARVAFTASNSLIGAGAAVWLAAATSHWFFQIRPDLITFAFVVLFLLTRNLRIAPWLWPPMVALWANLHGGFLFGIGAIGLHVLGKTLAESLAARRFVVPWHLWVSVAACLVIWMANPWGWRLIEYPLTYADADNPYLAIQEWRSTPFSLDPLRFEGRFWLLAAATLLGAIRLHRRQAYLIALSAVTFVMAAESRRFIPLFAITAAPLAAAAIGDLVVHLRKHVSTIGTPAVRWITTTVALATAVWLWSDVHVSRLLERWTVADLNPEGAVLYLRALESPGKNVLNEWEWGGYLLLHAPEYRVFIDGRANTLYDDEFYREWREISGGAVERLRKYPIDLALLSHRSTLARRLTAASQGWRSVYSDSLSTILVPPGSPLLERPLPDAQAVLGSGSEGLLERAQRFALEGDLPAARREIEQALAANPLRTKAYQLLAATHAEDGNSAAVERTFERALATYPRRARYLGILAAELYERMGDYPSALRALGQAEPRGPFGSRAGWQQSVRRIEARLAGKS